MITFARPCAGLRTTAILVAALLLWASGPVRVNSASAESLLWEVKSEDATVFLLGSIHVARKDLYPLKAEIEQAFERSDHLVVEVNMTGMDPEAAQALILRRGMYHDGTTLNAHVSDATFQKTKARLKRSGMAVDSMRNFKPWFVAMTLSSMEVQRLGFDPEYGIDLHFLKRAQGKKPILQLESFEEQVAVLDGFSGEDQEAFLLYTMEDLDNMEGAMDTIIKAWVDGDAESIDQILKHGILDRPGLERIYERLVLERNSRMLTKIEEFLRSGEKYFVVVGAGHLVGDDGLVHALKRLGRPVVRR